MSHVPTSQFPAIGGFPGQLVSASGHPDQYSAGGFPSAGQSQTEYHDGYQGLAVPEQPPTEEALTGQITDLYGDTTSGYFSQSTFGCKPDPSRGLRPTLTALLVYIITKYGLVGNKIDSFKFRQVLSWLNQNLSFCVTKARGGMFSADQYDSADTAEVSLVPIMQRYGVINQPKLATQADVYAAARYTTRGTSAGFNKLAHGATSMYSKQQDHNERRFAAMDAKIEGMGHKVGAIESGMTKGFEAILGQLGSLAIGAPAPAPAPAPAQYGAHPGAVALPPGPAPMCGHCGVRPCTPKTNGTYQSHCSKECNVAYRAANPASGYGGYGGGRGRGGGGGRGGGRGRGDGAPHGGPPQGFSHGGAPHGGPPQGFSHGGPPQGVPHGGAPHMQAYNPYVPHVPQGYGPQG